MTHGPVYAVPIPQKITDGLECPECGRGFRDVDDKSTGWASRAFYAHFVNEHNPPDLNAGVEFWSGQRTLPPEPFVSWQEVIALARKQLETMSRAEWTRVTTVDGTAIAFDIGQRHLLTAAEIQKAVETVRRTGTVNEIAPALVAVTDAALILVDLIDNGEVIEWCASHRAQALIGWYLNRCPVGANTYENSCCMVPKLLVGR